MCWSQKAKLTPAHTHKSREWSKQLIWVAQCCLDNMGPLVLQYIDSLVQRSLELLKPNSSDLSD